MGKKKQAKILSNEQIHQTLQYLERTRNRERNKVIFALSVFAGLRAKEIAQITVGMILTSDMQLSNQIELTDDASKGESGRCIPIGDNLRSILNSYLKVRNSESEYLIVSERGERLLAQTIVNQFKFWYSELNFFGCSSHSGRRTFITVAARNINQVGGSLRDVQDLAGHKNLKTTQNYIEINTEAKQSVINIIGQI